MEKIFFSYKLFFKASILSHTRIDGHPVVERKATYVFKKDAANAWVCAIDNSYGHDLLEASV